MKCLCLAPRTLLIACVAVLCVAAAATSQDDEVKAQEPPVVSSRVGDNRNFYDWIQGWGTLPEGVKFGNTHGGVVVDKSGRVYMNTDSENAVIVFEEDGTFVKGFGKELANGLHGMAINEEDGVEYLYLTHLGRHEVLKTTLDGEILWKIGYPEECEAYTDAGQYKPTGVAVAPNGDVYVGDGYGLGYIHQYDKEQKYVRSWGGSGTEDGKFRTPHGLIVDPLGPKRWRIVVADRENGRIQIFDQEGNWIDTMDEGLRRPCHLTRWGDGRNRKFGVADLAGRVTILNYKHRVETQLGDQPDPGKRANNGVAREHWKDGEFLAPHSSGFDAHGNLYVIDWLALGRVTKLVRKKTD